MNEFYVEHLIKRNKTWKEHFIKIGMIALTIASVSLMKFHIALLVVPLVLMIVTGVVFFNLNVEYEYFYMNGNLEIDRIASKRRRKRIFEMKIYDLDVIAPEGAPETQPYRSVRKKDYSSGKQGTERYEMIVTQGKTKRKVILEPSYLMLEGMKKIEPRKVVV